MPYMSFMVYSSDHEVHEGHEEQGPSANCTQRTNRAPKSFGAPLVRAIRS